VGVAFDLYPSFGIIIQFMTVLSLLGCKFNNLYIILNSMVEFCNECEINSDDEEDFIDTTFEDIFRRIIKKYFLKKNTEEGVINEKILSDAELKLYLTRA
jgi:hypothetical protein